MKNIKTLNEWCKSDSRKVSEQADYLGLSAPQYWRIRKGGKTSIETAMRLQELTGVQATHLLGMEKA
jgi:hypothetical protein